MDYTTSKFLKTKKEKKYFRSFFNKLFICIIIFLILLIVVKKNPILKDKIYSFVYENNISFSKFKAFYDETLGGVLPFDNVTVNDTVSVFSENISYKDKSDYENGVKLIVDNNYLVPVIESGIVVYMGEKDKYGYTVIIQQNDGVDAWYSNVNSNIKLYDYVEKGSLLGEAKTNDIYLYFQKNGEFIDYDGYI